METHWIVDGEIDLTALAEQAGGNTNTLVRLLRDAGIAAADAALFAEFYELHLSPDLLRRITQR